MFKRLVSLAAVLSPFLLQAALHAGPLPGHETAKVADGVYAALTGPSYETPAEIRAGIAKHAYEQIDLEKQ